MARFMASLAAVLILLIATPSMVLAINCNQVLQFLTPCIPYARSGGGSVPAGCCNGVKGLNGAVQTTPDRQTACSGLKTATASIAGIKPAVVAGIPSKCSVNIPYPVSPSTDCSKVK